MAKDWKDKVLVILNEVPSNIIEKLQDSGEGIRTPINIELETLQELFEETKSDKFEVEMPEIDLIQQIITFSE